MDTLCNPISSSLDIGISGLIVSIFLFTNIMTTIIGLVISIIYNYQTAIIILSILTFILMVSYVVVCLISCSGFAYHLKKNKGKCMCVEL